MSATAAAIRRDAVVVDGPEARSYLQGQASQDVSALEVGASAWSWILQPAGKVDALVRVSRSAEDTLVVDTDPGSGDALLNRLSRFKLRTKAEISPLALEGWALRGPGATAVAAALAGDAGPAALALPALWSGGEDAADLLAPTGLPAPDGWALVDATTHEQARIRAGVPVMGAELTERTIPAETGLVGSTVSFTKGCYTGQELVARIDSRGSNVARHLRVLRAGGPVATGADVVVGERTVGVVTSAAPTGDGGWVALAYVGRAVEPGALGTVVDAGGGAGVEAHIDALPPRS